MGRARRPHARSDGQHRLRAGRGRRAAGESDAVPAVLSREAAVLPGERAALSGRAAAERRPVLLAPHRPVSQRRADRHHRRRTAERKVGRLQRRRCSTCRPRRRSTRERDETIAPANNFTVAAHSARSGPIERSGRCSSAAWASAAVRAADDYNRAYGLDLAWQATTNGRCTRVHRPHRFAGRARADRTMPAAPAYTYANNLWNGGGGYTQVGDRFNPEVGFLRRRSVPVARGTLPTQLPAEPVAVDPPHPAAHELHGVSRICRTSWRARRATFTSSTS